jgi:hypothetical protein
MLAYYKEDNGAYDLIQPLRHPGGDRAHHPDGRRPGEKLEAGTVEDFPTLENLERRCEVIGNPGQALRLLEAAPWPAAAM